MNFLGLPVDPAAIGRGETGTAFTTGPQSLTLNPAHVNKLKNWEVFYNRQNFKTNTSAENFSYFLGGTSYRLDERNILAIYWRQFGFGEHFPVEDQNDMSIGLVLGRRVSKNLVTGITIKYLRSSIAFVENRTLSANSWAIDLGINRTNLFPSLTVTPVNETGLAFIKSIREPVTSQGVNIGIALLNAGPNITYIDGNQANPIPQRLRIGLAYQAVSSDIFGLQALFDFEKELVHWNEENSQADSYYKAWFTGWKGNTFKEAIYHFGIEMQLISILKLRYGYRYEPFQQFLEKGVSTLGFSVETQYASLHYGKWIDKDNISALNRGSYVLGISISPLQF